MARDANATRRRLLDAAREEFAAHGIAGARVDRIAASSGANKAQIYNYFDSKDGLFDAVFAEMVAEVVARVPIEVTDLAEYAARLAELYAKHPHVLRLATWQRLERPSEQIHPAAVESIAAKMSELTTAQEQGLLRADVPPGALLLIVQHLAGLWANAGPGVAKAAGVPTRSAQRRLIYDLVERAIREH